jgi:LysM repeat protein
MQINDWLKSRNGRRIDVDGFPDANVYQCWDLWSDYAQRVLGLEQPQTVTYAGEKGHHRGYACNVFHGASKAGLLKTFEQLSAAADAHLGDVAFWDKGARFPGSHVAIVVEDRGATLLTLSQNPGAAQYVELPKVSLIGYLRPRADVGQGKPSGQAPAVGEYIVRKGDTLGAIAKANRTTVAALVKANGIADPDKITTGQRLKLTGKQATAPQPAPQPARPAPAGKRVLIGSRIKLATPWVRFRHSNLTGRMASNIPAGTYPVVGISNGNYRLRGSGYDGWVHASAAAGLQ